MPFKSKAQRRKFAELLVAGKISDETYEEWNRETGRKKLPERVKPKARGKRKRWRSREEGPMRSTLKKRITGAIMLAIAAVLSYAAFPGK
jgi:hypothetical protein